MLNEVAMKDYLHYFSNLRTAKKFGLPAPHKAVLLLSVMELVEAGVITGNRIELSERLEKTFQKLWKRMWVHLLFFRRKWQLLSGIFRMSHFGTYI